MQDAQPPQAQQHEEAPSMPVAAEPEKPAPAPPPRSALPETPSGLGFLATVGAAASVMRTDLSNGEHGSVAGGGLLHLVGSGFSGGFSYGGRRAFLLGGGNAGLESMFAVRAFVGGGPALGDHAQLFFRIGAETTSLKNDEVEASSTSIPAGQMGVQLWGSDIGFMIAPRVGLAARTEYEPGDESLGRRHWRKLGVRAAPGGEVLFSAGNLVAIDASYLRILDEDPVDIVDGRLCLTYNFVAACGFGQYWRSIATLPIGGPAAQEIPMIYVGGSIGIGETKAGHDKIF